MLKTKVFYIILIIAFLAGCQATTNKSELQDSTQKQEINHTKRVPQSYPEPKRDESPHSVAERLTSLAMRISQVNDATAIVFGDYAIVGIDVDAKLDRSRVGIIKYSVAEALKEDPIGAKALVTSDPDIVQRLREINVDIKKGHIIKGLTEELSDIVARIMPIAPQSVEKKEKINPTKERSKTLEKRIEE